MIRSRALRRRRKSRRAAAMVGDAMDLFLDAMTNALGVIMFILLMVVLFGRPEPTPPVPDQRVVQERDELRKTRDELAQQVAALPPPGDPELAARWRKALQSLAEASPALDRAQQAILQRTALLATEQAKTDAAREALAALTAHVESLEHVARAPASNLVRVSRFHADARKPVLLAISGGRIARMAVTAQTTQIDPPQSGQSVGDAANARMLAQQLLANAPPTTHRVELVVWADSFAAAKAIEHALIELGYDTNPMPVPAGSSLKAGTGGVQ
ncbi:MAG: hypothetical protein JNK53_07890 [Phycisphaerae bacterium]|nr:hypothetical protein [Phycisphaerae bacterium]